MLIDPTLSGSLLFGGCLTHAMSAIVKKKHLQELPSELVSH